MNYEEALQQYYRNMDVGNWPETLEVNRIYKGDCLEGIQRIPSNSVRLIVADPPYHQGLTHNGQRGSFVATHPKNRAFLCLDCHTCYDKAVAERDNYIIDQMAVVEVLRERYKEFQAQIPAEERKNIPEYLLIENDGKQGKRAAGNKKNK